MKHYTSRHRANEVPEMRTPIVLSHQSANPEVRRVDELLGVGPCNDFMAPRETPQRTKGGGGPT